MRALVALPAVCVAALMLAPATAGAATYYVRADGGTAAQCDGTADAPRRSGSRACAWRHPFVALPPGGRPRIDGGDTLVIANGSYMMGLGAPGAESCSDDDSAACVMAPVPSGRRADRPTRIVGEGHDSGCKAAPELWATQGASTVLNLEGSSHVQVACLEITDHSDCIKNHNKKGTPRGETARCIVEGRSKGQWGGFGLYAADSSNVVLRDLHIHGMARNGVRAGRLRDWTIERVRIRANGWAGWDGNLDEKDGRGSSNSGRIHFKGGEIAWNGCAERYPGGQIFGCWAQKLGGYGDGVGTAETGGHWVFEDVSIHHNTSDGLDLLYMNGSGSVTVRRVRAQGNAGNQIKLTGAATIENTIALGNCSFFERLPGSNLIKGDHCRASGNAISLRPTKGAVVTLRHNTISGHGDCLMITSHGDATARVVAQNNAFIGGSKWSADGSGSAKTCGYYAMESQTPVKFENNLFWNVRNDFCPEGNVCERDPKLTRVTFPDFDATPRPGSPLINAGKPLSNVTHDFFGRPRPAGGATDIGAVEVQSATLRSAGARSRSR